MELQGKHIVITGGGQGLGRAMAVHLAQQGCHLSLIDLNEDMLAETVPLCTEHNVTCRPYIANVAEEPDVERVFSEIVNAGGHIDGLVNNAGIIRDGLLLNVKEGKVSRTLSLEKWQSVIDVNLTGVFLCTRAVAAHMVDTGTAGVIVSISSISRAGNMGQSNYTAAKAGVAAMSVTWAKELARYHIRVGAVAPGFIETEMTQSIKAEVLEKINQSIPLGRMGLPKDIAQSVEYILRNDYFTGRIIECDGGLRI